MRRWFVIVAQLVILLGVGWTCHSTSGFLATWLGLAVAVDKYLMRWLPWKKPVAPVRELAVRASYFVVGAVIALLWRLGAVPWWEAVWVGVMFSLTSLVVHALVEMIRPPAARFWWPGVAVRVCLVALLAVAAPVLCTLHRLHTGPKRTPAAFGLPFEDVRIPCPGASLAAWVVPHPEARGNVIFCHGHGRNRGHVAGVLQTLHDLRLNVLAFDFRGHGDSPGHTLTFGRHEVDDLVAIAAYLRQRYPDQPLFLVGVSYGAAVSLQALPRLGDVRGVWSEGSFARFDDVIDANLAVVPAWFRKPLERLYTRLAWLDCGIWCPDIRPIDFGGGAHVPICFCHGEDDDLIPFEQAQALYEAYTGPKSCYWVPNASHYRVRQDNREEYLRRMREFMEGLLESQTPVGLQFALVPTLCENSSAGIRLATSILRSFVPSVSRFRRQPL